MLNTQHEPRAVVYMRRGNVLRNQRYKLERMEKLLISAHRALEDNKHAVLLRGEIEQELTK